MEIRHHMIRTSIFALSALALAACGGANTATDTDPTTTEETQEANPIDQYIPWPEGSDQIQTTASGLQYIIVRKTDEGVTPTPRDRVTVHYDGRLTDGDQFDASYNRGSPSTFGVTQVISGWTEGLQLMSEGDEFIFYIPSNLGYGQNPRPGGKIKPGDDLIFRVEMLEVEQAPPPKQVSTDAWANYTPWNSGADGVVKTGSGVEYVVIESGNPEGEPPAPTDTVIVHYEGRLDATGETFDSSFARGLAADFERNRVIPGWQEALGLMRPGDRWLVHIPSGLAYGPRGTPGGEIPPNSNLNFEVELMDVLKPR